jgi:hypothetical protein
MPRGLKPEGQKLWTSVTDEFDLSADRTSDGFCSTLARPPTSSSD